MKLFSSLLINQTLALAQVFFLSALINCLAIFSVIYLLAVYERVIPTSSENSLITLTTLAILAVVLELTIRFIRSEIVERTISRFCVTIQLIPRPAKKLSLATADRDSLLKELETNQAHKELLRATVPLFFGDLLFSLAFFVAIYWLGGLLVAVPILASVFLVVLALYFRAKSFGVNSQHVFSQFKNTSLEIQARLSHVVGFERSNEYHFIFSRIKSITNTIQTIAKHRSGRVIALTNLNSSLQSFVLIGVIFFGARSAILGELELGVLFGCIILSTRVIAPFAQLGQIICRTEDLNPLIENVPPTSKGLNVKKAPEGDGDIELADVFYRYPGNPTPVFTGINLKIRKKDKIGIVGPNSSGKSTLLYLIAGRLIPTSGVISLGGESLSSSIHRDSDSQFALLEQVPIIFGGSIQQNITLDSSIDVNEDAERLRYVFLKQEIGKSLKLNSGVHVQLGGRNLSLSQSQLLQLERAAYSNAPYLLLDEPTSFFDPKLERIAVDLLLDSIGEKTLIVATNRHALLKKMDRIIYVNEGKIIIDAPSEQALRQITRQVEQ